jgi:IS30 family transposase
MRHVKLDHGRLRFYVMAELQNKWSLEQISHRLVKDFPDDSRIRVCMETIHQAVYALGQGALKKEIAAAMRYGRTARKPRRNSTRRTSRFVDPMTPNTTPR